MANRHNQRRRSQQRAALNRPALPFEQRAPTSPPADFATYPASRTIIESKAIDAPFQVFTLNDPNDDIPTGATFYAGTADRDRGVRLATTHPTRAVVMHADEIIFSNHNPFPS